MEVKVKTASVEIKTVKLTKGVLKQFQELRHIPKKFMCGGPEGTLHLKKENVVGWFKGIVLGEEFKDYLLFSDNGDYFIYSYVADNQKSIYPQIYIV